MENQSHDQILSHFILDFTSVDKVQVYIYQLFAVAPFIAMLDKQFGVTFILSRESTVQFNCLKVWRSPNVTFNWPQV